MRPSSGVGALISISSSLRISLPSSTASAIFPAINLIARMASSLHGMRWSMFSGLQLVSTNATIGIFLRLASCTAVSSRLISTTKIMSGTPLMWRIPLKWMSRRLILRSTISPSFFTSRSISPESRSFSSCSSSIMRWRMVIQLVSVPGSQRSITYGISHRSAST